MREWLKVSLAFGYIGLLITLQFLTDANVITMRTGYLIVEWFLGLSALAIAPYVIRLALTRQTWQNLASWILGIPAFIRSAGYLQLIIGTAFIAFLVYCLSKQILALLPILISAAILGSAFILSVAVVWAVPKFQARSLPKSCGDLEIAKLENEYRRTIAQILTTVFLIGTLYFTWRQLSATEDGKVTDRFAKSIDLLSSAQPSAQIGGIYAMERISHDSSKDYPSVVSILTLFIGERTTRHDGDKVPAPSTAANPLRLAPEVQAALTVLCRRSQDYLSESGRIFLNNCNLQGARIPDARLGGAVLVNSDFTESVMIRGDFRGAFLDKAILVECALNDARFDEASMHDALLMGANFTGASLVGADLRGADLTDARGIDLLADATAANIADVKATEEIKKLLLQKGAVDEPDYSKWIKTRKAKIPFRTLYADHLDD